MSDNSISSEQSLIEIKRDNPKIPYYIMKNQLVGMLIVIYGPMFSEKTTKIIELINSYLGRGLKVVLIRHSIDTRTKCLKTHDGHILLTESILTIHTSTLNSIITEQIQNYDAILIDEGQFFDRDELQEFYQTFVMKSNKILVVSGLITDKDMKPFPSIRDLLPYADKTHHMIAYCKICQRKKGIFTKLLESTKNVASDNNDFFVKIGGDDFYQSLCRTCCKTLETNSI